MPRCVFAWAVMCASVLAGDLPAGVEEKMPAAPDRMTTAADVVLAVAHDLKAQPLAIRPAFRYFWCLHPDDHLALAFALNYSVSRTAPIYTHDVLAGGAIARVRLDKLTPRPAEFVQAAVVFSRLAGIDPYFHTHDETTLTVPEFTHTDGKKYRAVTVDVGFVAPVYGLAGQALHALSAADPTQPAVGVLLRADWFARKAMTQVDGGKYYAFKGLKGPDANQPAVKFDEYLRSRGIDPKVVAEFRSENRAAMFRSKVTGKPRWTEAFRATAVRPDIGTGTAMVTHDIFTETVGEAGFDVFRNLLKSFDDGREVLIEGPNGLWEATLFDSAGNLVDSAPDRLVSDHTIEAPHDRRLEPVLSCIACHSQNSGWQTHPNQVREMLAPGALKVPADLSQDRPLAETLDKLYSAYEAEFDEILRLARTTWEMQTFKLTQGVDAKVAVPKLLTRVRGYVQDMVDAETALAELGIVPLKIEPPPAPPVSLRRALGARFPEDPILAALMLGLSVDRKQWERVYLDAVVRTAQSGGG